MGDAEQAALRGADDDDDVRATIRDDDGAPAEEDPFPLKTRRRVFILIFVTQLVVNYDSGALAAMYGDKTDRGIVHTFDLDQETKGLLASIVYPGLTVGCMVTGPLLQVVPPKLLLAVSLVLNTAFAAVFSVAPSSGFLFAARCCVGVTQAVILVYGPVWTDQFAPEDSKSTWMAAGMAGVPLGIVVGYLTAGFLMANFSHLAWGWPFYIQAMVLFPCSMLFILPKAAYLQVNTGAEDGKDETDYQKMDTVSGGRLSLDGDAAQRLRGLSVARSEVSSRARAMSVAPPVARDAADLLDGLRRLLRNGLMWTSLLSLCSLYFVVNGLQMWVTDYLTNVIKADLNVVVPAFGATAITGPIAGVVMGGTSLDKIGGYRGHIDKAALLAVGLGFCAALAAYASMFVYSFVAFMILIWFTLFFGGAVVPCLTGMVVASVDVDLRGLANAFSGMTYNLLGYFLGPFACGLVAKQGGLKWGFRAVMGTSAVAVLFAALSYYIARRKVAAAIASAAVRFEAAPPPEPEAAETPVPLKPRRGRGMTRRLSFVAERFGQGRVEVELQPGSVAEASGTKLVFPEDDTPEANRSGRLNANDAEFVLAVSFALQQSEVTSAMARRRAPTVAGVRRRPAAASGAGSIALEQMGQTGQTGSGSTQVRPGRLGSIAVTTFTPRPAIVLHSAGVSPDSAEQPIITVHSFDTSPTQGAGTARSAQ
eukprot:TRINITY_DN3669_c0_g1_i1.p1 TRINITY_DN3669_c0_g1~~TRINITY_DN3669_c0_g1_i1.p1  ORF type:complete len:741 (+),score=270.39 TRINITY_DN3669_c0_g1_i1:103-2223(+)